MCLVYIVACVILCQRLCFCILYSTVESIVVQYLYVKPRAVSKRKNSSDVSGTTVLFRVLYCKIKNVWSFVLFMYYLGEMYSKSITVQYYTAGCGSRVCMGCVLSHVWPLATSWTVAHQAPLSMGFSRQEYWSGFPFPSPGSWVLSNFVYLWTCSQNRTQLYVGDLLYKANWTWSDLQSSASGGEGNGTPLQYSCLENPMDGGAWWAAVHGVAKSRTRLSDFIFTFHFHALEKEMATHSSVLASRIPGMGEPGGLPSMGSHRVRHDWSDLAAAAASGGGVLNEDVSQIQFLLLLLLFVCVTWHTGS